MCQWGFWLVSRKRKSRTCACPANLLHVHWVVGQRLLSSCWLKVVGLVHQDARYHCCAQNRCLSRALLPRMGWTTVNTGPGDIVEASTLRMKSEIAGALFSYPLLQHRCPHLSYHKIQWLWLFTSCIFEKSESIPCEWSLKDLKLKLTIYGFNSLDNWAWNVATSHQNFYDILLLGTSL